MIKEKFICEYYILLFVKKGSKFYIVVLDLIDYGVFENFEFSIGFLCEVVVVDYN